MTNEARVIKSTGSWYTVQTSEGDTYEARLRGKFKLENKKITNPIAVGDIVSIESENNQDDTWIITKIQQRTNYIIRKSPKKTEHGHILAANIDQAIVIATLTQPRTSLGFIDRFLVTAETFRIPARILFNKKDLLSDEDIESINLLATKYAALGYPLDLISAHEDLDVGMVLGWMREKLTLLSGHSGVGKSTLINQLIPGLDRKVAAVSSFANKGVHTTTFAEIFEVEKNSYMIDTPGIKELGLLEVETEELSHYFPEMREKLGQCKFNNCLHVQEPGCAVRQAVDTGEIWSSRYISYLSMLEDSDNRR